MADLTHLDKKGLQTFIDNDLSDFLTDLDNIRKDNAGIRALKSLLEGQSTPDTLQENQILALGSAMAGDDSVHGASLIKNVSSAAGSIDEILAAQKTLFKDIDRDLRETITKLFTTQDGNLSAIDGAKMIDIFSDVDDDLSGPGDTGSSNQ